MSDLSEIVSMTHASFHRGLESLVSRDRDLAGILLEFGPPPIWQREPGFATLV
ncbi:MAG: hypothetical protein KME17_20810 [Cyanosarcina radialis HA8281-LM2]|jgi:DNA-3-methyladenine glycosylase II|nr:hypothetical protein [Cyanosarcina radialis HA8281-LM2]